MSILKKPDSKSGTDQPDGFEFILEKNQWHKLGWVGTLEAKREAAAQAALIDQRETACPEYQADRDPNFLSIALDAWRVGRNPALSWFCRQIASGGKTPVEPILLLVIEDRLAGRTVPVIATDYLQAVQARRIKPHRGGVETRSLREAGDERFHQLQAAAIYKSEYDALDPPERSVEAKERASTRTKKLAKAHPPQPTNVGMRAFNERGVEEAWARWGKTVMGGKGKSVNDGEAAVKPAW